jgi:hypothetical protein
MVATLSSTNPSTSAGVPMPRTGQEMVATGETRGTWPLNRMLSPERATEIAAVIEQHDFGVSTCLCVESFRTKKLMTVIAGAS